MRRLKYLIIVLLIALVVLAGCTFPTIQPAETPTPTPLVTAPPTPTWTPPQPPVTTNTAPLSTTLPDFVSVIAKVKPSVVAITTEVVTLDFFNQPFMEEGAGSGWILDKNGLIVTNNHVIEGANTITVTFGDDTVATGTIVGVDAFSDLAVVKVDKTDLPAVTIGDSTKLRIGDWVLAIGNALGEGISATEGIVSRSGASITVSSGQTLYDLIQTSAAINPGNSGGPLVNMAGEVIGITSAKLAAVGIEGLGYAISITGAMPVIESLVQKGYVVRPWMGIQLATVDQFLVFRYNLAIEEGAFVTRIVPGGPADKAGLKVGDVIVKMNGKNIDGADSAVRAIRAAQSGQQMAVSFWRGRSQQETTVTLVESPPPG